MADEFPPNETGAFGTAAEAITVALSFVERRVADGADIDRVEVEMIGRALEGDTHTWRIVVTEAEDD